MKRIGAAAVVSALICGAAWLLACGPSLIDLLPVLSRGPADSRAFDKGDLGVVRPGFALGYQLQAYRTLAPRSSTQPADAAPAADDRSGAGADQQEPVQRWVQASRALLGPRAGADQQQGLQQSRHVPGDDYQTFLNCPDAAFAAAVRTLEARRERFGADSAALRDWARAQAAVFENCPDGPLVLPAAAADNADELTRGDRAYQTAAAYFYAMQFEQASTRFKAIAADTHSSWRPFGRYLAARANIRLATVPTPQPDRDRLAAAETVLRATLADAAAAPLHPSARGLLGFVAARLHPIERLHELSGRLRAPQSDDQDFYDYRFILNAISDTRTSPFPRSDIVRGDDLTDWLLTMREGGDAAAARALERWRADKTPHWLVAALWQTRGPQADADALLDAARLVDRRSPAFPTVAFLRVRLLADLGRTREARAVLASLPDRPAPLFGAEAINLLKAERLMLSENLDQFLANAPRAVVVEWDKPLQIPNGRLALRARSHAEPVLDEDSAQVLAEQLPLDRLVDAALSGRLPQRLRLRVAMAAFTRAIVLRRDEAGARVLPLLRDLAPVLRADLDRYARAGTADDRYRAGVLLLLNTPGASVDVRGDEDEYAFSVVEPAREFDHVFRRNWWCDSGGRFHQSTSMGGPSPAVALLYPEGRVPAPAFVSGGDRAAAERERRAILAQGPAGALIAKAAIQMAVQHKDEPVMAEALARVVEGWRWVCTGDAVSGVPLPQQAFNALHRLFPNTDAARRTKFWYRY